MAAQNLSEEHAHRRLMFTRAQETKYFLLRPILKGHYHEYQLKSQKPKGGHLYIIENLKIMVQFCEKSVLLPV